MFSESNIYILIALIAFGLIAVALVVMKKRRERFSGLVAASLMMVTLSTLFDDRLISYSLIGLGIGLAVFDIVRKRRKKA